MTNHGNDHGSVAYEALEMEFLRSVGDLWARGWSLIPLRDRSKTPAIKSWTPYQSRPATFAELEAWYDAGLLRNIGVVTGMVSRIFVLDCDSDEALAWAGEHMPPCDMRVRTAKGIHLYFPHSCERPIKNKVRTKFAGRELELDIRADGGYVVGPGSVHQTGLVYAREGAGWGRL